MKRGEIWTASGAAGYGRKPRPVAIVQHAGLAATTSVTVCGLTTNPTQVQIFRVPIAPTERNGLRIPCRVMIDKIITIPKVRLGDHIGVLEEEIMAKISNALILYLGLTAR